MNAGSLCLLHCCCGALTELMGCQCSVGRGDHERSALLPAQELKERHRQVMQAMLMDMLRALATPNMDIRKKTLDIALDLINQHNIDEVPCSTAQGQLLSA